MNNTALSGGTAPQSALIAVLDDEPFICDIIARVFRSRHQVEVFSEEASLFHTLESGVRFDLIFCDLMLDGTDGRFVFDTIQERWGEQAQRIVFLSGIAEKTARAGVLKGLDNRMIEKPFTLSDIRDALSEHLARF